MNNIALTTRVVDTVERRKEETSCPKICKFVAELAFKGNYAFQCVAFAGVDQIKR